MFMMVSVQNAKLTSFFCRELELWRGEEEGSLGGRLGSFIVMQKNATIKNIILEDVSSLITHRASSKLSSRWVSSFNEILELGGKVFYFAFEKHISQLRVSNLGTPTGSAKSRKISRLNGPVSRLNCISLLFVYLLFPFPFFPSPMQLFNLESI